MVKHVDVTERNIAVYWRHSVVIS